MGLEWLEREKIRWLVSSRANQDCGKLTVRIRTEMSPWFLTVNRGLGANSLSIIEAGRFDLKCLSRPG